MFTRWRSNHAVAVEAFENFLVYEKLAPVVPTYQLLRSASTMPGVPMRLS